jgi:homoserine acetyltransferase
MKVARLLLHAGAGLALLASAAGAADYPAPKQGEWIARDFRFHTGEVMPELRLHYTTVGEPSGQPVLIEAAVLAINSADDERNPAETGLMANALKRIKNARLHLIPASEDTRGHGTTGMAKFWKGALQEFLQTAPRRTM